MPARTVRAVLFATILSAPLLVLAVTGCQSAPPPSASSAPAEARETRTQNQGGTLDDRGFNPAREESRGGRPRGPHGRSADGSQPGSFDFYLLNLSWSPEFCATHSGSPECAAHPGFVVHGLWPQNTSGTYPENCSNAPGPSNPGSFTDLLPTVSLIQHEWTTHGTCSGLSADAYFALIRRAFQETHIPPPFTAPHQTQTMLSPDALLAEFSAANPGFPQGSLALSCGNNYLTAVEVCMDKSLHPQACQGVRSCRANVVKITSR
ncbi:MAG: hypothetical protein NVSMB62_01640 [Acidobacteriaceae bacterium]